MAHSPGVTLLRYVGNFQPRKVTSLPPHCPLATILDQHLTVHASSGSSNFGFVEFTEFNEKMQIGTTQRFRFKAQFNSGSRHPLPSACWDTVNKRVVRILLEWWGSSQMTNNWINLDLIEIIQFCLEIHHLLRHPHPWVCGWLGGWVSGSMGGVKSND